MGPAADEPYDSIDEYDEGCFKGEADRAALMQMSDLDREMLLADRYERRQTRRELLAMRAARRDAAGEAVEVATSAPKPKRRKPTPRVDRNIYTAERIVAEREQAGGVVQFLVRWAGYGEEDDTWEPVENLLDPELLANWAEEKQEAEEARARAVTRTDPHAHAHAHAQVDAA